jgi:hypothetical protein
MLGGASLLGFAVLVTTSSTEARIWLFWSAVAADAGVAFLLIGLVVRIERTIKVRLAETKRVVDRNTRLVTAQLADVRRELERQRAAGTGSDTGDRAGRPDRVVTSDETSDGRHDEEGAGWLRQNWARLGVRGRVVVLIALVGMPALLAVGVLLWASDTDSTGATLSSPPEAASTPDSAPTEATTFERTPAAPPLSFAINEMRVVADAHYDEILGLAFSDDGTRLVSRGGIGQVNVWTSDGDLLCSFEDHIATVFAADFDASGSQLVTAAYDGTARVYRLSDCSQRLTISHDDDFVTAAVFTADAANIITAVGNPSLLQVWRSEDGSKVMEIQGVARSWLFPLVATESYIAAGDRTEGDLLVWESSDLGDVPERYDISNGEIESVSVAADSGPIVSDSLGGVYKLAWQAESVPSGRATVEESKLPEAARAVAEISPGAMIYTVFSRPEIRVFTTNGDVSIDVLAQPREANLKAMAVSSGMMVATGGIEGDLWLGRISAME